MNFDRIAIELGLFWLMNWAKLCEIGYSLVFEVYFYLFAYILLLCLLTYLLT